MSTTTRISESVPKLFEQYTIREIAFRNRLWVSPMCMYSSDNGFPNDWHLVHLGSRAVGGAGLVCVEATAVSPEGRITPADSGIWLNEHVPAFSRLTRFIKAQGAVPGIQIAHAGRKASTAPPWEGGKKVAPELGGWEVVAPSPIAFSPDYPMPREMDRADIKKVIDDFAAASRRAVEAGFEVIEVHAAHGYLLHEFLSPLSNKRTDEYGGSLENRMRLPIAVAETVRKTVPENLPVFVRISATDWAEGGWDLEQSIEFAKELKANGIDLIDCSSGGLVADAHIAVGRGYQVPFSEAIRREAGIATVAVGMITDAQHAEEILRLGKADAVMVAREFLRDPYFAYTAARELGGQVDVPRQYGRAIDLG
jgi:2,4-dienoyl-CoA reductase-like NADH-dependent reductase (Old Yellow Enzyme family)